MNILQMIRKELRMHMRTKRDWWVLSIYQLILIAVTAIAYWEETQKINEPAGATIGEEIFFEVVFTQLAVLLLLSPVFSAGSLTIEHEQKTISGLLSSLLSPFEIWWGKFTASLLYLGLLWISSLPIMSIVMVLGGVEEKEILIAFAGTGVLIGCFCSVGMFCSSLFRRSVLSTALAYAFMISLNVLTFILYMIFEGRSSGSDKFYWEHAPILLNPFYCMLSMIKPGESYVWKYDWLISLSLFIVLGLLSAIFAIRNIRRTIP
jgi:ABC-2 type transport system permease protein